MDLAFIQKLIKEDDPIQTLYDALVGEIWTAERLSEAQQCSDLMAYLRAGEHQASALEWDLYRVYGDFYALLEADDPRQDRAKTLHERDQYTLLLIDALSLRETPLVQRQLAAHNLNAQVDFALASPPTETSDCARKHYSASGPSDIAGHTQRYSFAFRHVASESWQPDFAPDERERFIWYAFPDDYFHLKDTDYTRHVIRPVERILDAVLGDPTLVCPLVITSDHGYLWQGERCAWALDSRDAEMMARHFKHGRSTATATQVLADSGKAWVQGKTAAARGRFGWGSKVRGGSTLFKHGGVSLMECVIPWVLGE